jgi:carbon monoxide dehydrogenase subunit G
MAFSEAAYYREFKRVRNRFRRYEPLDLIVKAIEHANGGRSKLEKLQRHPWLMMLLIKWILTDDNFEHLGRPKASSQETNALFQAAYDLSRWTRMPNEYQHLHLFMRSVAHQQFLFQREFSFADIARQFVLFADLDQNHRLSRSFREGTGLNIEHFLDLMLGLVGKYLNQNFSPISRNWFSTLFIPKREQTLDLFFSSISATPQEMRKFLLERGDGARSADEYVEQTPLMARPLINLGGNYWPLHTSVLFRSLEHYIYDHLRAVNPESFMQSFGKLFEKYVDETVATVPFRIFREEELKRRRKVSGKVVDFVIDEPEANVFIDAKGVAGTHEAMVAHASQILRDRTKAAALKAVAQANELLSAIVLDQMKPGGPEEKKVNVLLVVTYKDLHLGNGTTFEKVVAPADIQNIYGGKAAETCVPLENIYFISIEAFEALCGAVEAGETTFSDAVAAAKVADSKPETKMFDFRQHLEAQKIAQRIPANVRKRLDRTIDQFADRLGANIS